MLTRRLQVLLDEDTYKRVNEVARIKRISISAVIRDAVDKAIPPPPGTSPPNGKEEGEPPDGGR